jgi:CheY-like chemotaxis protein
MIGSRNAPRLGMEQKARPSMTPTVLGRLRRFARLVLGNQRMADARIISLLESAATSWMFETGTNANMAPRFSRVAAEVKDETSFGFGGALGQSTLREVTHDELGELPALDRMVYVLMDVEQYDAAAVAQILHLEKMDVLERFENAQTRAFAQPRHALVVEPDNVIGSMVASALRDRGISVDVVHEAKSVLSAEKEYDLIIAEPIDDAFYNNADLIADFARVTDKPVLWMTGSPDQVDPAFTYAGNVLAKPFDVFDLVNEVQAVLYVDPLRWCYPDDTFVIPDDGLEVSDEALAPTPAPIDAEVVDGQLRPAPGANPDSAVSFAALDALRRQLLEIARFQAVEVQGSNTAPRVKQHVGAIVPMLDQPLTEGMVLGLAVGIDGLARLLPIIDEELTRLAATDIAGFILDLQRFTNQFPVFRQFNMEASTARPVQPDEESALQRVVDVVIGQPDAVIASELKQQFTVLRDARAKQAGSAISDVAWMRSVSNLLKAVARDVKSFSRDTSKVVRDGAVRGIGAFVVALPVAGALHFLGAQYPTEFAALTLLLTRSREQIDKTLGKGKDDEK